MSPVKHACYILIQQIAVKQYPFCRFPDCTKRSVAGHHVFRRNLMGCAFNPMAVISLCQVHHGLAHSEPELFKAIAKELLGEAYEELRQLSLMTVKFCDDDLRRIRAALRKILEEERR